MLISRQISWIGAEGRRLSRGQQDVGHEGVATRCGVPSLRSSGSSLTRRKSQRLFPYDAMLNIKKWLILNW